MSKSKNYQRSEVADLKHTIRQLKQKITFYKKKCKRLVSEVQTLEKGFRSSVDYIDEKLDWTEVEEVIKYVEQGKTLPEMQESEDLPDDEYDQLTQEQAVRKKFLELIGR